MRLDDSEANTESGASSSSPSLPDREQMSSDDFNSKLSNFIDSVYQCGRTDATLKVDDFSKLKAGMNASVKQLIADEVIKADEEASEYGGEGNARNELRAEQRKTIGIEGGQE